MKLRNVVILSLLSAFLIGFLSYAQEPVTITFWHRFSARHNETLNNLATWFQGRYPHITVEFVYQGSYGDLQRAINNAVVAGETPTMTIFYENWIPPVADALLPLDDYLTAEEKADIIAGLMSTAIYQGRMLTVPFNKSIMVFYYIEDLVPEPPTTWEEYFDTAKELTVDLDGDGAIDRFGTGFRPGPNPEQFLTLLNQNEGTILNEDWTEVALNDELAMEAAEFYASLAPYSLITSEYLNENVTAIAMAIDTSAGHYYWDTAAQAAGLTVKVARVPGKKNQSSMIQGTNIGIFKSDNQAEVDAAILFLKFLLEGDNTGYWAAATGYMPVTYSGYASEVWTYNGQINDYVEVMSEQMIDGFSQILHPNYGDMRDVLSTMCEEIMLGAATVQDAVNNAAMEIEDLLE